MTVDVSSHIVINRSRDQVADYVMDFDNIPSWYVKIKSVEWKTPRPAHVGSQISFVAEFLGRRLVYTFEIVKLEPHGWLEMRTVQGQFPMETSYRWEMIEGGRTRMILRNRGEPAGFPRMAAPLMTMAMRSAMNKDLARLKRILEVNPVIP